jgi:hypothetical protein
LQQTFNIKKQNKMHNSTIKSEVKKQFPKSEVTIETIKKVGSLDCSQNVIIHYRDYKAYLDTVVYYIITGNKNSWYEIKSDFKYDQIMNKVKDVYFDSFGRKMKVNKI